MQTEERRKILIVDDDPMVLKVIRSYLKDSYKVYCIRSGEEALKFLSMQIPDVVLLDYMMPGMDGPEVFRQDAGGRTDTGNPCVFYDGSNGQGPCLRVHGNESRRVFGKAGQQQ